MGLSQVLYVKITYKRSVYKSVGEKALYFKILEKSKLPIFSFLWSSFHQEQWEYAREKEFL